MNSKQLAANEALKYIRNDMVIGLGSGSTSECFIHALGAAIKAGTFTGIRGVATSVQSEKLAIQLGIPLTTLKECGVVDVTFDGADEVDPKLNLIKGLGGALMREMMVEQNSRRFICLVDQSKLSPTLGLKSPLPVEVVPFCHEAHDAFFHSIGGTPHLRTNADGSPYITDNGNYIYHLKFNEGIKSPADTERKLLKRAGVVATGLFLSMAEMIIVGGENGAEVIRHH